MSAAPKLPPDLDALAAAIRSIVREEIERAEAKRRGKRTKGAPRSRSVHVAAALSATIAPANDLARARAAQALRRHGR